MYFLSGHFLPVSRTLSAFTTATKSPQSAWGVKIGLCLPRRTLAMVVAARPSTSSFTSMTTQLRWTVCLLPITVFMRPFSKRRGSVLDPEQRVNVRRPPDSSRKGGCPCRSGALAAGFGGGFSLFPLLILPQRLEPLLDARLLARVAWFVETAPLQLVGEILLRHVVPLEVVRV